MGGMMLLPAKAGTCAYCATAHGKNDPHNFQSVFYGMRFRGTFGRDVTHADCVAHLPKATQELYRTAMKTFDLTWTEPEGDAISEPYVESPGLRSQKDQPCES